MNPLVVSVLALALNPGPAPSPAPTSTALPSVHDVQGRAWALVHGAQLWVCWEPGPGCWRRVDLEGQAADPGLDALAPLTSAELASDPDGQAPAGSRPRRSGAAVGESWRLGFWGPHSLWIERGDQRFRLERGQHRARPTTDAPPTRLERARRPRCSPSGQLPALAAGRLGWRSAAPCPAPSSARSVCPSPPSRPSTRRPVPLRLRAGLELANTRAWAHTRVDAGPTTLGLEAGLELRFVVELGFDPGASGRHARARQQLEQRRSRRIATPAATGPAPLAAREQGALAAIACGGRP